VHEVCPGSLAKVPGRQELHDVCPEVPANVPAAQGVQGSPPLGLAVPGAHCATQTSIVPSCRMYPGSHALHCEFDADEQLTVPAQCGIAEQASHESSVPFCR
jgi:hypothetical protein